jgi:cell wall-associated NlpC family hydrolase
MMEKRSGSLLLRRSLIALAILLLLPIIPHVPQAEASSVGEKMVAEAALLLGIPYKLGGTSPEVGFDASGFVQYVHKQQGIDIPRTVSSQESGGTFIPKEDLLLGDVVFFKNTSGNPSFSSIYIGNSRVIAATPSTDGVAIRTIDSGWERSNYLGAKRYIPDVLTSEPPGQENDTTVPLTKAEDIVALAKSLEGTPYLFGGATPDAFDTSGFVQYVLTQNEISFPRTVRLQWQQGDFIEMSQLKPGDLLFFDVNRRFEQPTHIGIFIGDGRVMLTARELDQVTERTLSSLSSYYMASKRLAEIHEPLPVPEPIIDPLDQLRQDIIATGEKYLGVPYRFGAKYGSGYFDCSLFVQTVFRENGISLPRSSRNQSQVGEFVNWGEWEVGDLLFFYTRATGPDTVGHVAIYAGDGQILHTWGSPGVEYSSIESRTWKNTYLFAKRVIN